MTNENMSTETTLAGIHSEETLKSPADNSTTTETKITASGSTGFSIASMVCGILSLILCCTRFISIVLAIISLSLGGVSLKRKYGGRGMAIAGVVCSIISLALVIIVYIYQLATGLALYSLFY